MNKFEDDIKKALSGDEMPFDAAREEGVFRQMARLYRGKMAWMAISATFESIVFLVLLVLAAVEFFQAKETKWQIFYAACVLLLGMGILLIKIWGWMQMNRNAILREIKRLELRILVSLEKRGK